MGDAFGSVLAGAVSGLAPVVVAATSGTATRVLATAALVVGALITLLLLTATRGFSSRIPSGPDSMGPALFMLTVPPIRWLAIAVATIFALYLGAFAWVSPDRGIAALWVLLCHVGVGVAAQCAALSAASGNRSWWERPAAITLSGVVPVVVMLFLQILLWAPAERIHSAAMLWVAAAPIALAGAVGLLMGIGLLISWVKRSMQNEARSIAQQEEARLQNERDNIERESRHSDELAALKDTDPVEGFLPHLHIDKSDAHQLRAIERVDGIGDLTQKLRVAMENPDPLKREYCAYYIRRTKKPQPEWVTMVQRAMQMLASDIRSADALYDHASQRSFRGMTEGMLLTARCFPDQDFKPEIVAIREGLLTKPDDEVRTLILSRLDRFESGAEMTE